MRAYCTKHLSIVYFVNASTIFILLSFLVIPVFFIVYIAMLMSTRYRNQSQIIFASFIIFVFYLIWCVANAFVVLWLKKRCRHKSFCFKNIMMKVMWIDRNHHGKNPFELKIFSYFFSRLRFLLHQTIIIFLRGCFWPEFKILKFEL